MLPSYKRQITNLEFEKSSKIWENVSMNGAYVDNGSRWRRWLLVVGGGALLNFKNSASSGYSIFLHSGGATRLLTQPSQTDPDTKVRKYVSVLKWKLGLRWRPNHCVEIYNFSAWTPRCYVFWPVGFYQFDSFSIEEMNGSSGQPEHQRSWGKSIAMRESDKYVLTTTPARISDLLPQGGCWTALLRRNSLPQNLLGHRGPRPRRHPLRHPSQVDQLPTKEINSHEIRFSIFKKRKRTSFYPRLAIAYSLIVLIIIIRFGHGAQHQYFRIFWKCNGNIQVLWLLGNKHFSKDVAGSQNQVQLSLLYYMPKEHPLGPRVLAPIANNSWWLLDTT